MSTPARDAFLTDLRAAQAAERAAVVPGRAEAAAGHWHIWQEYCTQIGVSPWLVDIEDPIPILQVFAQRLRIGQLAPCGHTIRSRSVEDYLRSIGQTFARLGADDPRLTSSGRVQLRIANQLKGYKKQDPPPTRVKPVPIQLIAHATAAAHASGDVFVIAQADCTTIGFFYLMRPGEYAKSSARTDSTPFRLCDVQFQVGAARFRGDLIPLDQLALCEQATLALLTFTTQKNARRGEVVGQGNTSSNVLSPVKALFRRVRHLRQNNAAPTTPLHTVFLPTGAVHVTTNHITTFLRQSATVVGERLGIRPQDISARSLRSSGAMALLCAQVDPILIKLVGRWQSDEMLHYLHLQAVGSMHQLASRMLVGGDFRLLPNQDVPLAAAPLLAAAASAEEAANDTNA